MLKKTIISAAIGAALLAAMPAVAAPVTSPQQEYTEVSKSGQQIDTEGDRVPSEESNTVQESELTRKMIQAEKARNAAENDKYGGAITIIAMSIVLSALIILSILFLLFGKISSSLQKQRKRVAHGVTPEDAEDHSDDGAEGSHG